MDPGFGAPERKGLSMKGLSLHITVERSMNNSPSFLYHSDREYARVHDEKVASASPQQQGEYPSDKPQPCPASGLGEERPGIPSFPFARQRHTRCTKGIPPPHSLPSLLRASCISAVAVTLPAWSCPAGRGLPSWAHSSVALLMPLLPPRIFCTLHPFRQRLDKPGPRARLDPKSSLSWLHTVCPSQMGRGFALRAFTVLHFLFRKIFNDFPFYKSLYNSRGPPRKQQRIKLTNGTYFSFV